MKNKKQYIVPLIFLLLLQVMVFIGAWNLKSGIDNGFQIVIISVFLSILFIVLFFLLIIDKFPKINIRKSDKVKIEAAEKAKEERGMVQREFTDPKIVAEQIFKNVLLRRNLAGFGEKLLQNLANEFDGMQGVFYLFEEEENIYKPLSFYAILSEKDIKSFVPGEGIVGQAAMEEDITVLSNLPQKYRRIQSGLGQGEPSFLYFIPFFSDKNCTAIIELSTFKEITGNRLNILNYLIKLGAKKLSQFREKTND
ncbi:MAG: GAF domain-containing protein [Bacteroidales bacterium]|nr:GAF domain-containing protein [Bacteroidales bacterium]MCF8391480.1 GAF domain-containing protein [Bacteroidales bacterium]